MDFANEDIKSLVNRIKSKQIRVIDVIEQVYKNIEENNNNAFINTYKEQAISIARKLDDKIKKNEKVGSLVGVPIAIKDNICVKEMKTTCASLMLEDYISPYNASVIEALLEEDAIIIGKTNMDEFGMGSTCETSSYGNVINIYDNERVVGGSSGGSATALVSKQCLVALGSDTGGSIRQPASYMGLVGIKPTYGSVSRYGLVSYVSSFDTIGPMARGVEDAARILNVISRYDDKDSTCEEVNREDLLEGLNKDIKGMKIAFVNEYMEGITDKEIKDAMYLLREKLIDLGAVVEDISLKMTKYVVPTYYVIACAQASSNLARYDGVKYGHRSDRYIGLHDMYKKSRSEGFGIEVKRRIMLGNYVLSKGYYEEYYLKALKAKELIKREYLEVFKTYDAICAPIVQSKPPKVGESLNNPVQMYKSDIYTTAVNIAGVPAISMPIGRDKEGLPIGVQFIGKHFDEKKIIQIANKVEKG